MTLPTDVGTVVTDGERLGTVLGTDDVGRYLVEDARTVAVRQGKRPVQYVSAVHPIEPATLAANWRVVRAAEVNDGQ